MGHKTFILDMLQRIILKSKYEIRAFCVGLTWLGMKSEVWLWKEYKLFSSVRAWNVMNCRTVTVFS